MENNTQVPDFLNKIINDIPKKYRYCFFVSLATGILVHFLMLSNKITNLDDLVCVPGVGGGKVLGRWFQEPVHDLFSAWSNPALNGIMAIIILSLTACVITKILKIQSITGAVLIGVMMITLPSTASNMYYMYLAPTFALSILASVINVHITIKYKFGFILGALLQFLSMACYQAYFGLSVSLFVLAYLLMLIDGMNNLLVIKKGIRSLFGLIVAMGGYLISLKFVDLSDYKGLSDIGHTAPVDILYAVARAYHRVLQYFVTSPESFMKGAPTLFNRILVVMLIAVIILLFVWKKVYSNLLRCILSVILILILPLALGLVYVMAPQLSHASTVMIYSYSVFYFFLIAGMERIAEAAGEKTKKAAVFFAGLIFIVLILEAYSSARMINNAYYRSYIAQNRVMEYYNRIFTKLEDTEGYQYGEPMVILGGFYPDPLPVSSHNMNGKELVDFEGATLEDLIFLPTNRDRFIQIFLGIDTGDVTMEQKDKLMETEEFKNMPSYPASGCTKKIDGIWVIKLNEDDR
ncbi:glucosyltransferase domain-containing protein [Butyrivibrio sp. AE3004]|uniref:glucosyltransferase domain-containing protein n=1 Tax=Butyrivibrio sp. AE3004 TaxID=1506994 RepID=UPI0004948219|nr:glucosyltransferase domain-containing protein [Butyrivibrio sp. AE3004]